MEAKLANCKLDKVSHTMQLSLHDGRQGKQEILLYGFGKPAKGGLGVRYKCLTKHSMHTPATKRVKENLFTVHTRKLTCQGKLVDHTHEKVN